MICRTEQEQRVWDAAFGAACAVRHLGDRLNPDDPGHAETEADWAVECLRQLMARRRDDRTLGDNGGDRDEMAHLVRFIVDLVALGWRREPTLWVKGAQALSDFELVRLFREGQNVAEITKRVGDRDRS